VTHVIVDEHLDELEVHPPSLYQRLKDVCVQSALELLAKKERFLDTNCPACTSSDRELAFEKHGYTYWSCQSCATLFVSPRPTKSMVDWYLLESPVAAFRTDQDYRDKMEGRVKELAAYRAEWMAGLCARLNLNEQRPVVDMETRTLDYFLELQRRHLEPLITVKPLDSMRNSTLDSISTWTTVNSLSDVGPEPARLITAFDVIEHQHSLLDLFSAANAALEPSGLLIITTRSGSGFDIQILWEHATIFPLEHINLVSIEGLHTLLERTSFEVLEESTPGQLDVQMIERILRDKEDLHVPRFLNYFLTHRDVHAKQKLQKFIQENRLSSHLRVVARKKREVT